VAKLYHKKTCEISEPKDSSSLLCAIETFVSSCRKPALLEYGEDVIDLLPGQYSLEIRSERLWVDVWNDKRSISRRILSIERHTTGALDCTIHRFGGKPGKLTFLDLDRPQTAHKSLCGVRQSFGEQFRRMLFRQFPGWEIEALSCSIDLQRSFSPVFPRARISRGTAQIAAMACPSIQDEPAFLTSALLWFDHVRAYSRKDMRTSMCLFLPENAGNLTAHRLRWLVQESFGPRLFRFNSHGSAGEVDPQDLGNLETRVKAARHDSEPMQGGALPSDVPPRDASERMLESIIRSNIATIDAMLLPSPIHGQVLTFAAGDRDLIDLLAVSCEGRLAVLELKITEDLHLPMQALDYWMRIRWHAERNELQHLFPRIPLANTLPKLLLVAPAMSFHSSNALVLRYFSPEIEVERVGVNSDWDQRLKVVLRLSGADMPISHRSSE
jgi:hypothetical protein